MSTVNTKLRNPHSSLTNGKPENSFSHANGVDVVMAMLVYQLAVHFGPDRSMSTTITRMAMQQSSLNTYTVTRRRRSILIKELP